MTYKVGDYVRVRSDLKEDGFYGLGLTRQMLKKRGKPLKVIGTNGTEFYRLEDGLHYTRKMLEPVDNLKIGDKVRVREDLNFSFKPPGIVQEMINMAGKEYHITNVYGTEGFGKKFNIDDGCPRSYLWLSKWLDKIERKEERVNQKTYSLTQNKNTTVLLKKENGKVVSRGIAKCMDGDNFDENFGIIMAAIKLAIKSKNKLTVSQVEELRRTLCGAISEESLKESYDNMMEGLRDLMKEAFLEGGLK